MEEWRDIEGYEGLYQVSNEGRVKSLERYVNGNGRGCLKLIKERILKQYLNPYGYPTVTLHDEDSNQKQYRVHRLVAQAFMPNLDKKPYIDHINTVRKDNRVENLRWATPLENNRNPITYGKLLEQRKDEEYRKRMSNSTKGKIVSEETKRKMSEIRKGVGCIAVNKYTLNDELITTYPSIDIAAEENNCFAGDICRCCKGKRKSCGGFIWRYA